MSRKKGFKHSEETKKKIGKERKGRTAWNKGKTDVYSDETLKKMSEAAKGRTGWNKGLTKETDERVMKMSEAMKGDKNPAKRPEVRKKISETLKGKYCGELSPNYGRCGELSSFYGKKHTEETKMKISQANSGENSPHWKGGIAAEPYCDVWLDGEYKESIKERDNFTCQSPFCLCDSSNLCIHHINYVKKNCIPNNLITLCKSSNSRANKDRWVWQEIYEKVIERKIKEFKK